MPYATPESAAYRRREVALLDLRNAVKRDPHLSYRWVANIAGVSTGWVGEVLRGNYPHYGACLLPKNIRLALETCGLSVPECLVTF